jgi:hypothetical protein
VRKKIWMGLVAGATLAGFAAPAKAQLVWDSPLMVSPATPAGWGVYLVDPHPGPGIGVMSTFRASSGPGLGYRIGLAEYRRAGEDRLGVYGGIDLSGMLLPRSSDFPLDVLWVTGAGVGIGEDVRLNVPLGVSMGYDVQADGIWFNPYVTPRIDLDARFGSGGGLRLAPNVDLGVDMAFDPGWAIRFAGTIGDHSALAIGLSFRVF